LKVDIYETRGAESHRKKVKDVRRKVFGEGKSGANDFVEVVKSQRKIV